MRYDATSLFLLVIVNKKTSNPIREILLTVNFPALAPNAPVARAALATGALGYVVKPRLVSDLIVAVNEALAGRTFISPSDALGNLCQP